MLPLRKKTVGHGGTWGQQVEPPFIGEERTASANIGEMCAHDGGGMGRWVVSDLGAGQTGMDEGLHSR